MARRGGGGKGTPGLRRALRKVDVLRAQLNAETDADYAVALSALGAGNANLRRQLGRIEGAVDASLLTQQRGLRRNLRQARAGQRNVRASQARAVNAYGAALGASAARQFAPAAATAAAGTATARGAARAGRSQQRIADVVQGIAAEGASAQASAAKYALAQAMQARNTLSAETIAGLTGQLYQTALQYQQQWDLWKRQQDYARKQAEKTGSEDLKRLAEVLPDELPQIGLEAWQLYDEAYATDKNVNAPALMQAYADKYGYTPQDPQYQVFAATVRKMVGQEPQDIDTSALLTQSVRTLYGGEKGWEKVEDDMLGSIRSGTTTAFQGYYGPGGPGRPTPLTLSTDVWTEPGTGGGILEDVANFGSWAYAFPIRSTSWAWDVLFGEE